jgi:hypothetical protein
VFEQILSDLCYQDNILALYPYIFILFSSVRSRFNSRCLASSNDSWVCMFVYVQWEQQQQQQYKHEKETEMRFMDKLL